MADLIQRTDSLNTGREKLNKGIEGSERAEIVSAEAKKIANDKGNQAINISGEAKLVAEKANGKSDAVQKQFDTVVGAGTIDPAVEQMKVGSDGQKVYNSPDERVREEHQKVTAQLAQTKTSFTYPIKLVVYLSQGGSRVQETYGDEEHIRMQFESYVEAGIKDYAMCIQVQPRKAQRDAYAAGQITQDDLVYETYPTLDFVKWCQNIGNEYGMNLYGLKMHDTWLKENESSLSFARWFPQYANKTMEFANDPAFSQCEYLYILNEHWTVINVANHSDRIIQLLTDVKSNGFKTGFSGVPYIDTLYVPYIDAVSPHYYPSLGSKNKEIGYTDSLDGWQASGHLEEIKRFRKEYPDKEIIITESGSQHYWDALNIPAIGEGWQIPDETGAPNSTYFYGLLELFKTETYMPSLWLFYTNPLRPHTVEFLKQYTGGKNI